ncbi:MAG: hypothetical protein LBU34_00155 [Planctomycetaceae bacterium]|jgi:hypothetical protein|nr:hypothetical protein [Planctomycetaceae bacterium]
MSGENPSPKQTTYIDARLADTGAAVIILFPKFYSRFWFRQEPEEISRVEFWRYWK